MVEGEEPTDNPISLRRDNINDAEAQADASALALAGVFGAVSFPPGMANWQRIAIEDKIAIDREAAGDFIIENLMNPVALPKGIESLTSALLKLVARALTCSQKSCHW